MVTGKTILCMKEIQKGNLVSNFRPITCLSLIWKLLTGILAEELYKHLEKNKFITMGTKGMQERKRRHKRQLIQLQLLQHNY